MGLNFYYLKNRAWQHIGKRYAAGVWCWDCKCQTQEEGSFFVCPKCKQKRALHEISFSPVDRELGFDKSRARKHTGIDGASGFIWHAKNRRDAKQKLRGIKKLVTSAGESWSRKKFDQMFLDVIEEEFLEEEFC